MAVMALTHLTHGKRHNCL